MMVDQSCREFSERLASASPVPGGGGVSALTGALGAALGGMVGNLTLGKKKYRDVQEDIERILARAETLRLGLLELVDRDAEAFEPLSKAYGLPKETPGEQRERDAVMEKALVVACGVPAEIMEKALEVLALHGELARKGSRIALSDVGVGALLCGAALEGAALNIFINTKLMKDRACAEKLNEKADRLIREGSGTARRIYDEVMNNLRNS